MRHANALSQIANRDVHRLDQRTRINGSCRQHGPGTVLFSVSLLAKAVDCWQTLCGNGSRHDYDYDQTPEFKPNSGHILMVPDG